MYHQGWFWCFCVRKTPLKDDSSHCKTRGPQTSDKSPITTLKSPRCLGLQPNQSILINIKGWWTCLTKSPICRGLWGSPEQFPEAGLRQDRMENKSVPVVWCWLGWGRSFSWMSWRNDAQEGCPLRSPTLCVSCQEYSCLVFFSTIILPFIFWIIPKWCNWGISSTQGVSAVFIGLDLVLVCCARQHGRTCEMQLVSAFFRSFSEAYYSKKKFFVGFFLKTSTGFQLPKYTTTCRLKRALEMNGALITISTKWFKIIWRAFITWSVPIICNYLMFHLLWIPFTSQIKPLKGFEVAHFKMNRATWSSC